MSEATKYKPGDRVVGSGILFGRKHGAVVKPAKTSALVRWDGSDEDERVNLQHLAPETAGHVATREQAAKMEAWRLARPRTAIAIVEHDSRWGRGQDELGAELRKCRTPAEMRQAAAELHAIADWFERKPDGAKP